MMSGKTFLSGFIIGGLAAAAATLFTTPVSGKEARKACVDNSKAFLKEFKDLKEDLIEIKDSIASASKEGKNVIGTFVEDIKESLEQWKTEIQPHQEQLKIELNQIEQTVTELENDLKKQQ
ncbi:YtxH domain-containing protein [Niallia sp. SS-2023]|uniref:YtxH domain-containing protein n=1 Tax=Niallia sp. SS-2023 TaxID=3051155 RepID=UPI002550AF4B|nr:YtxH domain-containing protein [Niallia sp. SS-2023]MDL0436785.1 YtxH domain-containing protein [Niallia sp. SS-2023]